MSDSLVSRLTSAVRDVPDFPRPGILFKDITPVFRDPVLVQEAIGAMAEPFAGAGITHVVGIESRGFLFALPVALALSAAFVPARKAGKLPAAVVAEPFALEYGVAVLEIHADAFETPRGGAARVLIVDDIVATGGTLGAVCRLAERLGAAVAGISVFGEIRGLRAESEILGHAVHALVAF